MEKEPKQNIKQNLWNATQDWWDVVVAFGGAVVSAFNALSQLLQFHNFRPDITFGIGAILFFVFGSIAIIRAKRGQRRVQRELDDFKRGLEEYKNKASAAIHSTNQSGGITGVFEKRPVHVGDINYPLPQKEEYPPNIEVEELRIRKGILDFLSFNDRGWVVHKTPIEARFFEAVFSNNPIRRTANSTSRNIRAEITYYEDGKKINLTSGGWMNLESREIRKTVNLLFNGESETLLLAVIFREETSLFAFGLETDTKYFLVRERDFRYRLSEGEVKDIEIRVHLKGEKWDKVYKLILH